MDRLDFGPKDMKFQPKPDWIKVKLPSGPRIASITGLLRRRRLHTVCEEALCPNMAECWGQGTATLLLMGGVCTRGCRFCHVITGKPAPLDPEEPRKAAETVRLMNLDYVVLTSVDRDDLPDGGAEHFARTVEEIHASCPGVGVEALVPDFGGDRHALARMAEARPEVLAHNLETVERLTRTVRDRRASYRRSLEVLRTFKEGSGAQRTKSSLMLGLGERREELREAFRDLREAGVDFLTLGQYLQPTSKHLEVIEFIHPDLFKDLETEAREFGFRYVASGPLVRSSYRAGELYLASLSGPPSEPAKEVRHGL